MRVDLDTVRARAQALGLALRGGFHPLPSDSVPRLPNGASPGTVVLLGNVGPSLWERFSVSGFLDGRPNPLDDWSRSVISGLAQEFGAQAYFPFGGPPFAPFVRWAARAELVAPSPLGPLIHPRYGLWHAYRGALGFEERFALAVPGADRDRTGDNADQCPVTGAQGDAPRRAEEAPCVRCRTRACLDRCPAGAVAAGNYDVPRCVRYLVAHPQGACMTHGCQARHACPVGSAYRYRPEQARHHMRVFVRGVRARAGEEEGL